MFFRRHLLFLHPVMIKLINFLTLLAFINTISYFPADASGYFSESEATETGNMQPKDEILNFDGDTLLENLLDDVLEFPKKDDEPEPSLFQKVLSFLSQTISPFVRDKSIFFDFQNYLIHLEQLPCYAVSSKITDLPGYYLFLFRLQPF
jgi:hypothetical protein